MIEERNILKRSITGNKEDAQEKIDKALGVKDDQALRDKSKSRFYNFADGANFHNALKGIR